MKRELRHLYSLLSELRTEYKQVKEKEDRLCRMIMELAKFLKLKCYKCEWYKRCWSNDFEKMVIDVDYGICVNFEEEKG